MPHQHGRAKYQHVNEFKQDLREAGLSYCDISVHIEHAAITVMHEWNQQLKGGHTQRSTGTVPHNMTMA